MGSLASAAAELLRSRLGLAGMELRIELRRAAGLLLGAAFSLALGCLGLAFAALAVMAAAWESYRVPAALLLCFVFLAGALAVAWKVQATLKRAEAPFGHTLAAIEADRAALVERADASRKTLEKSAELLRWVSTGLLAASVLSRLLRAR